MNRNNVVENILDGKDITMSVVGEGSKVPRIIDELLEYLSIEVYDDDDETFYALMSGGQFLSKSNDFDEFIELSEEELGGELEDLYGSSDKFLFMLSEDKQYKNRKETIDIVEDFMNNNGYDLENSYKWNSDSLLTVWSK